MDLNSSGNSAAVLRSAEQRLRAPLEAIVMRLGAVKESLFARFDKAHWAENLAALMAPEDASALLTQSWEDAPAPVVETYPPVQHHPQGRSGPSERR